MLKQQQQQQQQLPNRGINVLTCCQDGGGEGVRLEVKSFRRVFFKVRSLF